MSQVDIVASGRNLKVFAIKETTPGTIMIPVAGSFIVANGATLKVPNPNFVDDAAARNSRSLFNRYQTNIPAGSLQLQHYLKPSGAAGTAPEGSDVLESLHGTKTVNAGTSVVYSPADTKPTFTLYVKKDHTVFVAAGCVAEKGTKKKDNKGILEQTVDGKFMSAIWTGTGSLGIAISTTPAAGTEEWFLVDDEKKFCIGSHILIDSEQMQITGTYWQGTAGGTAGQIKMKRGYNTSTVATHLINAVITPYLPAGTETGAPLAARVGTFSVAAGTIPFLDVEHTYDDAVTFNEDEVTGTQTPTDFFEGDRKVSGKATLYFRKSDLKWFADALKQTRKAVIVNYGSVAGSKIAISDPYTEFDMPEPDQDKVAQKMPCTWRSFASAGNDESTLTFN
jgi:hypothetical protein